MKQRISKGKFQHRRVQPHFLLRFTSSKSNAIQFEKSGDAALPGPVHAHRAGSELVEVVAESGSVGAKCLSCTTKQGKEQYSASAVAIRELSFCVRNLFYDITSFSAIHPKSPLPVTFQGFRATYRD